VDGKYSNISRRVNQAQGKNTNNSIHARDGAEHAASTRYRENW